MADQIEMRSPLVISFNDVPRGIFDVTEGKHLILRL
jgi:hypothetical protein